MKKLFLDDLRQPYNKTWNLVRNYQEFIAWINENGCPYVISFDHDLCDEHMDFVKQKELSNNIPYDTYTEKTGYDCAKWLVEQKMFPKLVIIHTFNPVGAENIQSVFEGTSTQYLRRIFNPNLAL